MELATTTTHNADVVGDGTSPIATLPAATSPTSPTTIATVSPSFKTGRVVVLKEKIKIQRRRKIRQQQQ